MGKPWEKGDLYGKSPFLMGKLWKDPPCLMGKSTISTGPCSIAILT